MTLQELEQYKKLNEQFRNDCDRVCLAFSRYNDEYKFLDTFSLENGEVFCSGDEYWNYGGHEHYTYSFNAKYLTYSDEELETFVDELIDKREKEEQEEKEKEEQKQYENDLKQYNELKKKLGL